MVFLPSKSSSNADLSNHILSKNENIEENWPNDQKNIFLIGYFGSCPFIHVVTGHHWLLIVQNISNLNPFSTPTFKVMNYMSSFFGSKIQLLKHELSPINGGYAAPETMSPPPPNCDVGAVFSTGCQTKNLATVLFNFLIFSRAGK